ACLFFLVGTASSSAQFPDARDKPPANWTGPVFRLSQDYPQKRPRNEEPWKAFKFKTQPQEYLERVLQYVYEGNVEVDWDGQKNAVRKWYHTPWLHVGPNGREFVRGLTLERSSRPRELHPNQTSTFRNWAVGLYNPRGGYTIGKVWMPPNAPKEKEAKFLEGTVAVKLLFTTATVAEVPFLQGAKEWQADINRDPNNLGTLRLLQIDIAVRDGRANATTGWVFGTFITTKNSIGFGTLKPGSHLIGARNRWIILCNCHWAFRIFAEADLLRPVCWKILALCELAAKRMKTDAEANSGLARMIHKFYFYGER
ncbi:MAG: hypothetical protein ACRENG_19445, partial [bacterium]